ncbi:MAG: LysE family translocator [Chitinophagales bacterium]|nr:LysE family translocator [Chitinophagales bacterium]
MHPLFELFYKGFLLGLISAFSFGPIFFSIIETSLRKGVYFAISIAVGVIVSDAMIIALSFLSVGKLIQDPVLKNAIGTVGGFLLIAFGIYHLIKPVPHPKAVELNPSRDYFLYVTKGFLINTLNPFVFIFWLSAVSIVTVDPDYNETERILFFLAAIGTNFAFDIGKSFLANQLKHVMTHRLMTIISRSVGVGIIFFGLRLLWKTLML